MMAIACCNCMHLKTISEQSRIVTNGTRNVSGELAKYRVWDKHRCRLEQEDRYPKNCDFKGNFKYLARMELIESI